MIGNLQLTLQSLLEFASRRNLTPIGNAPTNVFRAVTPMPDAAPDCISFCRFSDDKGLRYLQASRAGAIFILPEMVGPAQALGRPALLLPSPIPRLELLYLLREFWEEPPVLPPGAGNPYVSPDAEIGEGVQIGPFCVIGRGVRIGNYTRIEAGTVIEWADIGPDCRIGSHTTIGGSGFGYEDDPVSGEVVSFPHIGRVRIGARVEIGSSTCVDRAAIGETFIDDDAKIDNHVHVAHNVRVGKRSKIVAMTIIGGSVQIGEDCWIAPGVSIRDWREIADKALVGVGAVVTKDVAAGDTVIGNPARSITRTTFRYR